MSWLTHEPPALAERLHDGTWHNVTKQRCFSHAETEAAGLVFQHADLDGVGSMGSRCKNRYARKRCGTNDGLHCGFHIAFPPILSFRHVSSP